jgi:hypothetical protein
MILSCAVTPGDATIVKSGYNCRNSVGEDMWKKITYYEPGQCSPYTE